MRTQTGRLLIRSLAFRDWRGMQTVFRDFEQSRYRAYDSRMPLDDFGVKVITLIDLLAGGYYAVEDKKDSEMIGYVSTSGIFRREIGYAFKAQYQHQGYASEAVEAVIRYLHEEKGVTVFKATAALENEPSVRLLARLGFVLAKTRKMSLRLDGQGRPVEFIAGEYRREVHDE